MFSDTVRSEKGAAVAPLSLYIGNSSYDVKRNYYFFDFFAKKMQTCHNLEKFILKG